VIDCNEWRTEKRHGCANMGKVKRLELWWQLYRTSLPVWDLENFRRMDFCWHECTYFVAWRFSSLYNAGHNSSKIFVKTYSNWVNILQFSYHARKTRFIYCVTWKRRYGTCTVTRLRGYLKLLRKVCIINKQIYTYMHYLQCNFFISC